MFSCYKLQDQHKTCYNISKRYVIILHKSNSQTDWCMLFTVHNNSSLSVNKRPNKRISLDVNTYPLQNTDMYWLVPTSERIKPVIMPSPSSEQIVYLRYGPFWCNSCCDIPRHRFRNRQLENDQTDPGICPILQPVRLFVVPTPTGCLLVVRTPAGCLLVVRTPAG